MLSGAARRLRRGIDDGHEPFEVFDACQDHLLVAAGAHVDTEILEAFNQGVEACEEEASRALLDRVCDLYALSVIERHRGWYQEHDDLLDPLEGRDPERQRARRRAAPAGRRPRRRPPRPRLRAAGEFGPDGVVG